MIQYRDATRLLRPAVLAAVIRPEVVHRHAQGTWCPLQDLRSDPDGTSDSEFPGNVAKAVGMLQRPRR